MYPRIVLLTWNFGSFPKINFKTTLFSLTHYLLSFEATVTELATPHNEEKGVYLPLLAQNGQKSNKTDFQVPKMPPTGASWA